MRYMKNHLRFYFKCGYCKKLFIKTPKRIGNTLYEPARVVHTHSGVHYMCYQIDSYEYFQLKEQKE